MASTFTYPGVYIQEVPSTVHTIVPAPTAVAALVGRAIRGPINEPIRIHSFADFVRSFGGLWKQSELAYCVQEYFLNGGSDAYIVRAVTQNVVTAQTNSPAAIVIPTSQGPLTITAQNPGSWFRNVVISIDLNTRKVNGARKPDEFNFSMTYNEVDPVTGDVSTTVEKFPNVSYLSAAANYIVTTLTNDSWFIETAAPPPQAQPNPGNYSMNGMVWAPGYAYTVGTILIDPNGNAQQVTAAGTSGRSMPRWSTVAGAGTTDGTVTWTSMATVVPGIWQPLTQYTMGQLVFDGTNLQKLTSPSGTSGSQTPVWNSTSPDGPLTWTSAGPTGQWKPNTSFAAGAALYDPANDLQVVTTAGVSGAAAPGWQPGAGAVTSDNTVAWTNLGTKAAITGAVWTANHLYAVGSVLLDASGNAQIVTTGGTSGAAAPQFNEMPGGTTPEGPDTLVWTNIAASIPANWQPAANYQLGQLISDGSNLQQLTAPSGGGVSGAVQPNWNSTTPDGALIWTNAGSTGSWQAGAVYSVGAAITVGGNIQAVTAVVPPGKSGGVQPAFNNAPGQSIVDNNITWTNIGAASAGGAWKANTFYPSGAQIYDANGAIEVAQNAGTTGGTTPSWTLPTVALPNPVTNDGTIVWMLQSLSGLSDGQALQQADLTSPMLEPSKSGIYALKDAQIFTLLILPPHGPQEDGGGQIDLDTSYAGIWADALAFCKIERAMLLVDPPSPALWPDEVKAYLDVSGAAPALDNVRDPNSVLYYPWLEIADPLLSNRTREFAPSATVAGVMARIDATRGVWKSPAGEEAKVLGVASLQYRLTDPENGDLNPLAINCLRTFPIIGTVVWGARTLEGADAQASQWKYVAVRRMALFIEDSLQAGTGWAIFEPNDEPLWSELRLNVGSFMRNLFRQGAFQGATPKEAYFVKCDSDTTTQTDIDNGVVNILVGFAPLKPAEFVVIKISQITGDASAG